MESAVGEIYRIPTQKMMTEKSQNRHLTLRKKTLTNTTEINDEWISDSDCMIKHPIRSSFKL